VPTYEYEGVQVRFPDQAAGLSVSGLLSNQGTMHVKLSPGTTGDLFALVSPTYVFSLEIQPDTVRFRRNDYVAEKRIGPVKLHYQVLLSWDPTVIQLALMIDDDVGGDDACVTVQTPMTLVPPAMLSWARCFQLLPRTSYATPAEFLATCLESLRQTERTIRSTNCLPIFWDRSHKSPGLRHPKAEPEVMSGIAGFLQDQSVLGGYELIQESGAGQGSLDLRSVAALSGGGTTTVCIEGKNAHSQDLAHGITQQLPSYMTSVGASNGIYLVLWFKCASFDQPAESSIDITWGLTKKRPWETIVVQTMDLSLPLPPSNRRFELR